MKTMAISSYNHPLFSCIITLYTLILLYFPHALKFSASVVFSLTVLLLLLLLRLGAEQRILIQIQDPESKEGVGSQGENGDAQLVGAGNSVFFTTPLNKWIACQSQMVLDPSPNPGFEESFVEWDVRAPLEVIYEAYEGEEDEEDINYERNMDSDSTRLLDLERYPSLSMYYPDTDSDSSSAAEFPINGLWGSPERVCFEWEEEIREGLLIEIALDDAHRKKDPGPGFHFEEENLIEIDISLDSSLA